MTQKTRLLLLGEWLAVLAKTARLLMEYNVNHSLKRKDTDHHHEQIPIVQKTFIVHVKNMTDSIKELGTPFSDTSADLFALDSKQIMANNVVDVIKSTEDIGEAQYHILLIKSDSTTIPLTLVTPYQKAICLCYVPVHKRKLQSKPTISPI